MIPIDVETPVSHLDKVVHLCEYLLFAWLLVQAIRATRLREGEYLWMAWIYATSYGWLIELIQAMLPWRSADLADAVSNALGAALGVWLGQQFPRRA
ncbi:MAG: VanZ family protein [Candidatus Omnitrophica bacterium]|nr:VanZ family protein [Candidatus Omnitrophota bacterium]